MAKKNDGFDSKKRMGNAAIRGVGVNSPAMMEARKGFAKSKALKGKKLLAGSKSRKNAPHFSPDRYNNSGRPSDSDYLGKY